MRDEPEKNYSFRDDAGLSKPQEFYVILRALMNN